MWYKYQRRSNCSLCHGKESLMIRIKCLFGKHNWNGCMCKDCGETRNEGHTWNGCKCTVCGRTRNEGHTWDGCKCKVCGKTRDKGHIWDGCKCTVCGKTRDEGHIWNGCKCTVCGKTRDQGHIFSDTYEVREARDYDSAGRSVPESIVGYHQCKVCGYVEEVYVIEPHEM